MAKYPYNCDELDPEAWPYECRDFTPSVGRDMSDAEYAAFMAECADLADDAEAFRKRGCKRRAHRMMAGGRQQWRGKGAPEAGQRSEYYSALQQQDPTLTRKRRRTQRSLRQAGNKAAIIEQALTDMLFRRGQDGLPTMAFSPGRVPADFEQLIRQYAIPRRATAFREIYLRYGLNFFPQRLPELPLRVRILAFTQGLAALGITPRPSGREVRFQGGDRQQNLSAVIVNGKSDSQIVQRLNEALDDLRPSREPQAQTLSAFTVLMLTLQSLREGDTTPKVEGFVFGSQAVMLPRRAVSGLSEMQGVTGMSAPELQHLIYGVAVSVRLKPDIEKLRYITPADLARWLTGDTLKRKKRRGRTLARENPMKPKFINVANYQDLAPGSARELPDYPGYCVYRKATKNSESLPLEEQLVITTCKRAMSWMNIAQAYKSEPLTASENPMPRPKRKRIAPIARRRKVAKPAPIARRRKVAPKRRRMAGQFDPLAELIKEFAPAPKRRAAAPIAARPAKKIAHLANDPYATTVFHHGAGAIVPVNRRNPRRKKARTNPDAAAAMRLHHETGMSLKQAWRCVQDGNYDFGSQYEYRKGPYTAGDAMPPVNRRNPGRGDMEYVIYDRDTGEVKKRYIRERGKPGVREVRPGMALPLRAEFGDDRKQRIEKEKKNWAWFKVYYDDPSYDMVLETIFKAPPSSDMDNLKKFAAGRLYDMFEEQWPYLDALRSIVRIEPYEVKKARKNPSRKKTRTKSRKSEAAAAMKLHHKQGISLKQAWARVKRGKK